MLEQGGGGGAVVTGRRGQYPWPTSTDKNDEEPAACGAQQSWALHYGHFVSNVM